MLFFLKNVGVALIRVGALNRDYTVVTLLLLKRKSKRAHKEKICQGPFRAPKEAYIAPKLKSYTSHMGPLAPL